MLKLLAESSFKLKKVMLKSITNAITEVAKSIDLTEYIEIFWEQVSKFIYP